MSNKTETKYQLRIKTEDLEKVREELKQFELIYSGSWVKDHTTVWYVPIKEAELLKFFKSKNIKITQFFDV